MAGTRRIDWLTLVTQADPDFGRESRHVVEYRFSTPGGRPPPHSSREDYEDGFRIFRGDYQNRGPYAP